MAAPQKVHEPHKELRFTRAAQAQIFYLISAVMTAFVVFLSITWLMGHPSLSWWMPLLPATVTFFSLKLAIHCTRHAYLILTPLGVEIFPFWKPEKNLTLIYWSEIADTEYHETQEHFFLHRQKDKSSGIMISLMPVAPKQRQFFLQAMSQRMKEKDSPQRAERSN